MQRRLARQRDVLTVGVGFLFADHAAADRLAASQYVILAWVAHAKARLSSQKSVTSCILLKPAAGAGRMIPFSSTVLSFWDKSTMECAGAMPFRQYFTATAKIVSCQALLPTT